MNRKYVLIIKKQRKDGTYSIVYLDYKFSIEETNNKSKIIKKAEKLLKQKIKKEVKEDKILQDLEEVDIYELIQITV